MRSSRCLTGNLWGTIPYLWKIRKLDHPFQDPTSPPLRDSAPWKRLQSPQFSWRMCPCVLVAEEPWGHTGYWQERYFLNFRGDTFRLIPIFNCIRMRKLYLLTGGTWPRHTHTASKMCGQLLWLNLEIFLRTLWSAAAFRKVGKGSNNKIEDTFLIPVLVLLCQYHQERPIYLPTTALQAPNAEVFQGYPNQKGLLSISKPWEEQSKDPSHPATLHNSFFK